VLFGIRLMMMGVLEGVGRLEKSMDAGVMSDE
jgi:hypothetical protein